MKNPIMRCVIDFEHFDRAAIMYRPDKDNFYIHIRPKEIDVELLKKSGFIYVIRKYRKGGSDIDSVMSEIAKKLKFISDKYPRNNHLNNEYKWIDDLIKQAK